MSQTMVAPVGNRLYRRLLIGFSVIHIKRAMPLTFPVIIPEG